MNLRIEINEQDLKSLVAVFIQEQTGQSVSVENIKIEVKSKQNYKSEWEEAAFKAVYTKNT